MSIEIQEEDKNAESIKLRAAKLVEKNQDTGQEKSERLLRVQRLVEKGDYLGAQDILDESGEWDDDARALASEADKSYRAQKGERGSSYGETINALNQQSETFRSLHSDEGDRRAGEIEGILASAKGTGADALDPALRYQEKALQEKAVAIKQAGGDTRSLHRQQEELRDFRNAFFGEKARRLEAGQQMEADRSRDDLAREKCVKLIEELYASAASSNDPSQNKIQERAGTMEAEQLNFLEADLKEIQRRYGEGQDREILLESLHALSNRDFHSAPEKAGHSREDEDKLERLRNLLGTK